MMEHPTATEPVAPSVRNIKTRDILFGFGVMGLCLATPFLLFVIFAETVKPKPMSDWAITQGILSIQGWFPAGKYPANVWDLSQSLPFAVSWSINKIALSVSILLLLGLLAGFIAVFVGFAGALAYLPWRFYFKARIGAGSMPAPLSRPERGD